MKQHEEAPMSEASSSHAVGSKVRLTKSIWNDGADHHPPGWLGHKGEILVVRGHGKLSLEVSHEHITDRSFTVYQGEYIAA